MIVARFINNNINVKKCKKEMVRGIKEHIRTKDCINRAINNERAKSPYGRY